MFLRRFSIVPPHGWGVIVGQDSNSVEFRGKKKSWLAGGIIVARYTIQVSQDSLGSWAWGLSEEVAADSILTNTLHDSLGRFLATSHPVKGMEWIGGKRLYFEHYQRTLIQGEDLSPDQDEDVTLFVFLPPNMGHTRYFYRALSRVWYEDLWYEKMKIDHNAARDALASIDSLGF